MKKNFPHPDFFQKDFQFGLETEFMLARLPDFKVLWHEELSFEELNQILESVPFKDIEGRYDLLQSEPPSTKIMPFLVEGYHLPHSEKKLLPKGLEIRTPVSKTIDECLRIYRELHSRLQSALKNNHLTMVSLSHHPFHENFKGPLNKRRHDFWLWAMEAMTTYGPDINISFPSEYLKDFDREDFDELINYYAPALSALSAGSPFYKGKLWQVRGELGRSYRIHRRSVVAPPVEYHADEENRMEFKFFEMSPYVSDFRAYFLLCLLLVLKRDLKGRADNATRIYEMGEAARKGLQAFRVKEKLEEVLDGAEELLEKVRLDSAPLSRVSFRIEKNLTVADEMIACYEKNKSFSKVFSSLSLLRD